MVGTLADQCVFQLSTAGVRKWLQCGIPHLDTTFEPIGGVDEANYIYHEVGGHRPLGDHAREMSEIKSGFD